MKTAAESYPTNAGSHIGDSLRRVLSLIWCLIRLPIVLVLAFLEPVVRLMLSAIAVLSVVAGLAYKGSSVPPPIPFWVTLCVSVGCPLLIAMYQGLVRLLAR